MHLPPLPHIMPPVPSGGHRDNAVGPVLHEGEGIIVVAGEHRETIRAPGQDAPDLLQLSGCFLYSHDVGNVPGQRQGGFRIAVGTGSAGHVVKDYGLMGMGGNLLEISVDAPLRRLVVEVVMMPGTSVQIWRESACRAAA